MMVELYWKDFWKPYGLLSSFQSGPRGLALGYLEDSSEMGMFELRWYPVSSVTSRDVKGGRRWPATPGFPAFPCFL